MYKLINALILCIFLLSCAHRHSRELDDDGNNPTPTILTLNIVLNPHYQSFQHLLSHTKNFESQYKKRLVIEVRHNDTLISHQSFFPDSSPNSSDTLFFSANLELQSLKYDIAVWMDYVKQESDLHYITQNLDNVSCHEPYCGNDITKECLSGNKTVDLTKFHGEENSHAEADIQIFPPLAKYEIITTDIQDFLQQIATLENKKYYITFSYQYFFPTVFDSYNGSILDSWNNIAFTIPLDLSEISQTEYLLGFDYILADTTPNTILLDLTVKDENNKIISKTSSIKIPYKQSHITRIVGRFLTQEKLEGIEINTEFDDEINIDLDNITF